MTHKVFCIHANKFGNCNKKEKFLGIFKRGCTEFGQIGLSCTIADRPVKPNIRPHPAHVDVSNDLVLD